MEKLIGIVEAAKMLDVCKESLRQWDREGKLIALKTAGGHRRYRISDLEKFMENNNQIKK